MTEWQGSTEQEWPPIFGGSDTHAHTGFDGSLRVTGGDLVGTATGGVEIVSALPTLPDANYPEGTVVFLTTDDKLYRSTGSAWTAAVPTGDLTGTIVANQIAANAVTADKVLAGAITAAKLAATIIIASTIKSAASGARFELDASGFRLYDATGNTVDLDADTGDATLTGTVRTAASGTRWEMSSGSANQLLGYLTGVDVAAYIQNTAGAGAKVMELSAPSDTGESRGRIFLVTNSSHDNLSRVQLLSENIPLWFHDDDQSETTGKHLLPPTKAAVKTSNETVNNSATLQNDDALVVHALASSTYIVECMVLYTSATGADFKWAFSVPTGATITGGTWSYGTSAAAPNDDRQQRVTDMTSAVSDGGLGAGGQEVILIKAVLTTSTTAGNLQFRWAQNSAAGSNTTVIAGSYLKAERVA